MKEGVLRRHRRFLPITDKTPMFTLGEGDTPLVKSMRLCKEVGCEELYFKLEGCNPTGSFKDRGMVMAVARAVEGNSAGLICASTGNTSASASAYGARCGLPTIVLVPKGDIARGKLVQAVAYGAKIMLFEGTFDQALQVVREVDGENPFTLVNSINPFRLEGQKTAAFEVVDDLGDAPDYLFIPVGNAGNISAYWMGFKEYHEAGLSTRLPQMMGFQAEGAAPIVWGKPIENPRTVASAIRIGNPANWDRALKARDESNGRIDTVSDEEILEAWKLMSQREGIFCEPASAASLAGLLKLVRGGLRLDEKRVVCVVTGSGLKDPDTATKYAEASAEELPFDLPRVKEVLSAAI